MLTTLLTLALAQSLAPAPGRYGPPLNPYGPGPQYPRPRQYRSDGRSSRSGAGQDFAFFEFAPSNGAGMPSACQSPNYVAWSDDLTAGTWSTSINGVSSPVITANQDGVADKVDYPATTAAQESFVYQSVSGIPGGGTFTFSLLAQAVGSDFTFDLCMMTGTGSTYACVPCAAVTTGYTTCSTSGSPPGTPQVIFGNASIKNGGTARSAGSVLIKNSVFEHAASRSPVYLATNASLAKPPFAGAKGETITFTRASTATCTKTASGGLATTGIQNGDLVMALGGEPRVEYDGQGYLGLLVEEARTNTALWSQAFTNAAWVKEALGAGTLPTITDNFAVAPDGSTTAARVQLGASNAGQDSILAQVGTCTTGLPCTVSIYIKGNGTSGTTDIGASADVGATTACTYNATTWTRCSATITSPTAFNSYFGNGTFYNGGTTRPAQDVLVWGFQVERAAFVTSYIPTTTAAVTRAVESAPATLTSAPALNCLAGSITYSSNYPAGYYSLGLVSKDGSNNSYAQSNNVAPATAGCTWTIAGVAQTGNSAATVPANATTRIACSYDGTNINACVGGSCAATAKSFTNFSGAPTFYIGGSSYPPSAIISRIKLDPSAAGCQ